MSVRNEARLGMDITDFEKKLTTATNELNKFARGGVGNIGSLGKAIDTMTGGSSSGILNLVGSVGNLAASFGLAASAASIVSDSVNTAMNFEKSISSLKALTGLGDEEMARLKKAAIDLGSSTTQSASQVADAFKLVGSAKPELLGDVDALRDVTAAAITLAEASGMEVPDAAKALTTSLNQMAEGASEANRYVNVLAAASQKGAGDINWLNEAITQSGTAAKAVGASYETLVANLEQLAQGGYDASSAGTALRSIIMNLEKQANGNLKPSVVGLTQAFRNLASEHLTLSGYQDIVGKQFASQAMILAENAGKADEMTAAITGTNTAQEQAMTATDNFAGSVSQLSSAWEGLMLTINSNNGVLRSTVDMLTKAVNALKTLLGDYDFETPEGWFNTHYKKALDDEYKKLEGSDDEEIRSKLQKIAESKHPSDSDENGNKAYEIALKYIEQLISKKKEAASIDPNANVTPANGNTPKKLTKAEQKANLDKEIQEATLQYYVELGNDPWKLVNEAIDARGPIEVEVSVEPIEEEFPEFEPDPQKIKNFQKEWDTLQTSFRNEAVTQAAGAFQTLGNAVGGTEGAILSMIGTMAQQIVQGVSTISSLKAQETAYFGKATGAMTAASAEAMEAHSWIPFVGVAVGAGMVASLVATLMSLPKFAEGAYADHATLGIFGEAGPELVLPERKLDEAFERHRGEGFGGKVEFKIRDTELVGILNQYNKKANKRV